MKTLHWIGISTLSTPLISVFFAVGCGSVARPLDEAALDNLGPEAVAGPQGERENHRDLDSVVDQEDAHLDRARSEQPPSGWRRIPADVFYMGTSPLNWKNGSNEDYHQVTLLSPFEMARTETTQHQFSTLLGYNPSEYSGCGANCPVDNLRWDEAAAYCNKLSEVNGLFACYSCAGTADDTRCVVAPGLEDEKIYSCEGYRLPTEAEWEYAYRAGTRTDFYSGQMTASGPDPNADSIAWYLENSGETTHPVAEKIPNSWGLYDMSGNVWEWVHDGYKPSLGTDPVINPALSPDPDGSFVRRGGSFMTRRSFIGAAQRSGSDQNTYFTGVRCVRSL